MTDRQSVAAEQRVVFWATAIFLDVEQNTRAAEHQPLYILQI